jgi:hypothetical protein
VTAVLVAVGAVTGYFAYRDAEAAQGVLLREKAGRAAIHIASFFWGIEEPLAWELAAAAHPGAERADRRAEMVALLRRLPQVAELRWIEPAGRERLFVSRVAPDAAASGADFSADARFIGRQYRNRWWENVLMAFLFGLAVWGAVGAVKSLRPFLTSSP